MNLSKIKQLVKHNGDKFILVENGEAEAVVMSFAEYEKLTSREAPAAREPARVPSYPEARHEIAYVEQAGLDEDDFISPAAVAVSDAFLRPEEIRLEDLPL